MSRPMSEPASPEWIIALNGAPHRERIDEEIRMLEARLRALREQRNTFAPINNLPHDILEKIFVSVKPPFLKIPTHPRWDLYQWIAISHVSRQWRNIALDCPLLWADIHFESLPWVPEMLARSKSAPISILFKPLYVMGMQAEERLRETMALALGQLPRIETLELGFPPWTVTTFEAELSQPAPNLRSLDLSAIGVDELVVPPHIFDGTTPQLQRVWLEQCDFSWSWPSLTRLTALEVARPAIQPSLRQLLQVMQQSPNLERLTLGTINFSVGLSEPDDLPTVPLLSLSQLSWEGPAQECATLLSKLALPEFVSVSLFCYDDDANYSCLLPFLSNLWKVEGERKRIIYRLGAKLPVPGPETIICAYAASPSNGSSPLCTLRMGLHLDTTVGNRVGHGTTAAIIGMLPLDGLLHLDTWVGFSEDDWRATFGGLPRLRVITLMNDNASGLVQALGIHPSQSLASHPSTSSWPQLKSTPPFPALRVLRLLRVETGLRVNLECSLMQRQHHGVGLQRLVIYSCGERNEEGSGELDECAEHVIWNRSSPEDDHGEYFESLEADTTARHDVLVEENLECDALFLWYMDD